ncbi:MAG TPA: GDP-mannose 4,6-dehydratase [Ramlibacter sp.]
MRIALTGAAGFTGRHFIEAAQRAGHDVVELESDLTDRAALEAETRPLEADAAVHLAAISFVGHADARAFYDVNLFGTLNLLGALSKAGRPLQRILLASSANVYGNSPHSPIAESEPPAPVNHYAMSKLAMEMMARSHFPQLPVVIARPFNYTGPGQPVEFVVPKLVDHFRRRAPQVTLGNLHVEREYNDVRFVCEAYLRLLEAGAPESVYNICTGTAYDFNTVLALLRGLTGHDIEVQVDPKLVRPNEVHRLCGDPSRLQQVVGASAHYRLEDTLRWMLAA